MFWSTVLYHELKPETFKFTFRHWSSRRLNLSSQILFLLVFDYLRLQSGTLGCKEKVCRHIFTHPIHCRDVRIQKHYTSYFAIRCSCSCDPCFFSALFVLKWNRYSDYYNVTLYACLSLAGIHCLMNSILQANKICIVYNTCTTDAVSIWQMRCLDYNNTIPLWDYKQGTNAHSWHSSDYYTVWRVAFDMCFWSFRST